jgi:hypothetical protein
MNKFLLGIIMLLSLSSVMAAELWTTDIDGVSQTDFGPTEIVYIHGSGFTGGAIAYITILRPDMVLDQDAFLIDSSGNLLYPYDLTGRGMEGPYYVTVHDGINSAEMVFTDATGAVWTTLNDCGDGAQNINQYGPGDEVWVNGEGFAEGTYPWDITGLPSSCDPSTAVASGNVDVGPDGSFCFYAYIVQADDCGVYKYGVASKNDNYNIGCVDRDGDGFDSYSAGCTTGNDCDDTDPNIYPGAAELCNLEDDDCDGLIDEDFDTGGSCSIGVGECADDGVYVCSQDGLSAVCDAVPGSPTAEVCDGLDNDCDGIVDEDLTRPTECGIGACQSTGAETCSLGVWGGDTCMPGTPSPEICGNGVDDDCNGIIDDADIDQDSYIAAECGGTDCDDSNAAVHPGAEEICNAVDDDCDGTIDEGLTRSTACGQGECAGNTGFETCTLGNWGDDTCDPFEGAVTELCDNLDNDCDGLTDEDFTDLGETCSVGVGACYAIGVYVCSVTHGGTECNALPGQPTGTDDNCNLIDEDCDGIVDEDYVPYTTDCGVGVCASTGQMVCVEGQLSDTCQAGTGSTELCDAIDNDCDGLADEDFLDLGSSCSQGSGSCTEYGSFVCSQDMLSTVCIINTDTDGDPCDDGQFCTTGESCTDGFCGGGSNAVTDDGIGCTLDSCDEENDIIVNSPDNSFCSDGLACNGLEYCDALSGCMPGQTVSCSENDIPGVFSCVYEPDGNDYTYDQRDSFTSYCIEDPAEEEGYYCTTGDESITHECDMECGAECTADEDCSFGASCIGCECVGAIVCGNGIIEEGEQCDDGNQDNLDACRNDCTLPYCGDGIIDPDETCESDSDCGFCQVCNSCACEYAQGCPGGGTGEDGVGVDIGVSPTNFCPQIIEEHCSDGQDLSVCYHVDTDPQGTLCQDDQCLEMLSNMLDSGIIGRSYAFEGEKIMFDVSVLDMDGIVQDCVHVYVTLDNGYDPREAGCTLLDKEDWTDPHTGISYPGVIGHYSCIYTVEPAEGGTYGEYWISVEASDTCGNGCSDHAAGIVSLFLNPVVSLTIESQDPFGLMYDASGNPLSAINAGSTVYSPYFTIENTADPKSGLYMLMKLYATDMYDYDSSPALCPDSNVLTADHMEYKASHLNVQQPWTTMPRNAGSKDYVFREGSFGGNFLGVGDDITMRLRLNIPTPCVGTFDDGGQLVFMGEVI